VQKYKFLIKPILFIFIFGIITNILSYIFQPKNNSPEAGIMQSKARAILGEPENTIDFLMIGDSESYASYSPMEVYEEYGYTSYVMGGKAQKIYYLLEYLEEVLETQHPKYVILETNTIFRKLEINKKILAVLERKVPFIKYHNRWQSLKPNDFYSKIEYTTTTPIKGYYYKDLTVAPKKEIDDYMEKNNYSNVIPLEEKYYIKRIYDLCKENDIELILFKAPQASTWNYVRQKAVKELAKELDVEFIDANGIEEIGIDWNKDTRDGGDHVNYYGAKKVSKYIGKIFHEKGTLTDHREDPKYQSWNEDLIKYKQIIEDKNINSY
jgi:hypothetical protein